MTAGPDLTRHYDTLAATFDQHWAYSPTFVEWMTGRLRTHLRPRPADQIADVGCGTGLYGRPLADLTEHVTALDPAPAMIGQHTPHPRVTPIVATAEQFATRQVPPGARYDAILLKAVLHHLADRQKIVNALATRLRTRGRLLIVMLPPTLAHPLFPAALEHYARSHLTADQVAAWMHAPGLSVQITAEEFTVRLPLDRWTAMVSSRYMSLLQRFNDSELAAGVAEIRNQHHATVRFEDRYTFIAGTLPSA